MGECLPSRSREGSGEGLISSVPDGPSPSPSRKREGDK
jgi:hypothetical protein